jgi:ribosomal protein S18 acetylase RimI-like enzyme
VDELRSMQALVTEVWRLRGPFVQHHIGDLAWSAYFALDAERESRRRVWLDGERCIAWGWVEPGEALFFLVHPERPELYDEVLAWANAETTSALAGDEAAIDALERHGYGPAPPDAPFFAHLAHDLADVEPLSLPAGFSARHVRAEDDIDRRVAVHRAAWAPSRVTTESWRRLMQAYPYRPELDCVVGAPDGAFAASCLVWLDDQIGVGDIEPVGTDPRYARRGLAAAVCRYGLAQLRRLGGTQAIVHARGDAAYPAPKRLYESVGFREYARSISFVKRPTSAGERR